MSSLKLSAFILTSWEIEIRENDELLDNGIAEFFSKSSRKLLSVVKQSCVGSVLMLLWKVDVEVHWCAYWSYHRSPDVLFYTFYFVYYLLDVFLIPFVPPMMLCIGNLQYTCLLELFAYPTWNFNLIQDSLNLKHKSQNSHKDIVSLLTFNVSAIFKTKPIYLQFELLHNLNQEMLKASFNLSSETVKNFGMLSGCNNIGKSREVISSSHCQRSVSSKRNSWRPRLGSCSYKKICQATLQGYPLMQGWKKLWKERTVWH